MKKHVLSNKNGETIIEVVISIMDNEITFDSTINVQSYSHLLLSEETLLGRQNCIFVFGLLNNLSGWYQGTYRGSTPTIDEVNEKLIEMIIPIRKSLNLNYINN